MMLRSGVKSVYYDAVDWDGRAFVLTVPRQFVRVVGLDNARPYPTCITT